MIFKKFSVFVLLSGIILVFACGGSGTIIAKRIIKLEDSIPVDKLTKLVIVEGAESKRVNSRVRIIPQQSMDLYVRAADDSGNFYILPRNFPCSWSIVSYAELKKAIIEPMTEALYPTETIDAGSSRPAVAHVIRFTVLDQTIYSPVAIEARITFNTQAGNKTLTGIIQLEVVQSDIQQREQERPTFY
jgi:hypothetical protein